MWNISKGSLTTKKERDFQQLCLVGGRNLLEGILFGGKNLLVGLKGSVWTSG